MKTRRTVRRGNRRARELFIRQDKRIRDRRMEELKGTDADFQHPAKWLIPQGGGGWGRQRERGKPTGNYVEKFEGSALPGVGTQLYLLCGCFSRLFARSSFTILI